MASQTLNLDYLHGEAEGIHKSISAALKAHEAAEKRELLGKAFSAAAHLQIKVKEAEGAATQAELKAHLQQAEAQIASIIAVRKEELAHKTGELIGAMDRVVKHLGEAIVAARLHSHN